MRKLTAIIGAMLLAFGLAAVVFGLKTYTPWQRFPVLKNVIAQWTNLGGPKEPLEAEEEVEENVSYDEHIIKGDYYFEHGFYTLASNQYVRASRLEPKSVDPYLRLMRSDLKLGLYDKVKTHAEVVLALSPNHFEAQYLMALTSVKQSEFDKARGAFDALVAKEPAASTDFYIPYYQSLLRALNDSPAAEKPLRELRRKSKDIALNEKIDKVLLGYTEFNSAQAAEPLYLDELVARGLNQVGEYEMAIHKLKAILKERLDLRDSWIMLGFSYLNLEKYYFALTAFQKAYELDSEWPTTQYFLGVTHQQLKKYDDATLYFRYAIANGFEPQLVAKQKLADLYMEMGHFEDSVKLYQEILTANQQDLNSFVRPVWLYIDFLNKPEEAYQIALIASQLFPNEAMSYNLLGWSEAALGKNEKAEQDLKKAIQLNPNLPAAYYNLGKLYEGQSRKEAALQVYQKAYEADRTGSIGTMAAKRYNALLQK